MLTCRGFVAVLHDEKPVRYRVSQANGVASERRTPLAVGVVVWAARVTGLNRTVTAQVVVSH